jgi:hypothetical protein
MNTDKYPTMHKSVERIRVFSYNGLYFLNITSVNGEEEIRQKEWRRARDFRMNNPK